MTCPFDRYPCIYCGTLTWADLPQETPVCHGHRRMHDKREGLLQ